MRKARILSRISVLPVYHELSFITWKVRDMVVTQKPIRTT